MAIKGARVIELRHDVAIVCRGLAGADTALQKDPVSEWCLDRHIDAVPVLGLLAKITRRGDPIVDLTELVWFQVVEAAECLTATARQTRIHWRGYAVRVVVGRSDC